MHTSETHEARNQTRAGSWSSGLSANSFMITTLAAVQMPPADDKVREDGCRIERRLPNETKANKDIIIGIHIDFVSAHILQAKKS